MTIALRFHFGEVLLVTFFRLIIIIILNVSWISIVYFKIPVLLASAFYHSNIQLEPLFDTMLSRIFVAPSIYGVHHREVEVDTNSNYSTILSIWAKVFNTAEPSSKQAKCFIGVEGEKDETLIRLLIKPFLNI